MDILVHRLLGWVMAWCGGSIFLEALFPASFTATLFRLGVTLVSG